MHINFIFINTNMYIHFWMWIIVINHWTACVCLLYVTVTKTWCWKHWCSSKQNKQTNRQKHKQNKRKQKNRKEAKENERIMKEGKVRWCHSPLWPDSCVSWDLDGWCSWSAGRPGSRKETALLSVMLKCCPLQSGTGLNTVSDFKALGVLHLLTLIIVTD